MAGETNALKATVFPAILKGNVKFGNLYFYKFFGLEIPFDVFNYHKINALFKIANVYGRLGF